MEIDILPSLYEDFNMPPKEGYLYFPEGPNLFLELPGSKIQRKVFEDSSSYLPIEIDMLSQLNSELLINKVSLHSNISEGDKLRFLHAVNFNLNETIQLLRNNSEFRDKYSFIFDEPITGVTKDILNSGIIYVHGRDTDYRPIIVFNLSDYMKQKDAYTEEEWSHAILFLCSYVITKLLIPGQVETWNVILNLEDLSVFNSLPSDLRNIMSVMQGHYKGRLHLIYIFGLSLALGFIKSIYFTMYPNAEKKVKVINKSNYEIELHSLVSPYQLEKRFYGLQEDITSQDVKSIFLLIRHNKSMLTYFSTKNSASQNFFLTEKDYIERIKEGRVAKVSLEIIREHGINYEDMINIRKKTSPSKDISIVKSTFINPSRKSRKSSMSSAMNNNLNSSNRFSSYRRQLTFHSAKETMSNKISQENESKHIKYFI